MKENTIYTVCYKGGRSGMLASAAKQGIESMGYGCDKIGISTIDKNTLADKCKGAKMLLTVEDFITENLISINYRELHNKTFTLLEVASMEDSELERLLNIRKMNGFTGPVYSIDDDAYSASQISSGVFPNLFKQEDLKFFPIWDDPIPLSEKTEITEVHKFEMKKLGEMIPEILRNSLKLSYKFSQ